MTATNLPDGPFAPLTPTDLIKSLLADWFPTRDRLHDLRTKALLSDRELAEIDHTLNELVDIGDELVAQFAPDDATRMAITGDRLPWSLTTR